MGKRGVNPKISTCGVSGRTDIDGKKLSKAALLKLEHLQSLAAWASGDAVVLSLGAFFGSRFAACGQAVGIPPDDSLFTCERCEAILHPGDNCTVRIEKNKACGPHKNKGSKVPTQNNVVYKCHFCSQQTVKRGTLKGHLKRICPPKDKPAPKLKSPIAVLAENTDTESGARDHASNPTTFKSLVTESCCRNRGDASSAVVGATLENVCSPAPVTPLVGTYRSLLDTKKRIGYKSGSKKEPEFNSVKTDATGTNDTSKKRRRKTSTSLKDLVKSSQSNNSSKFSDIP
ncbi:unnamed protein product [Rhodiola kirilowii]